MKGPLCWFGGKGTMWNNIISEFPLSFHMYIEPFAGGLSVFFHKEPSPVEIINDLDGNVYALYKVIQDKELFKELKHKCDLSVFSRELKDEYKQILKTELSMVDRAYYFWYVNRTSRNGIGGFKVSTIIRRKMSKSTSDFLSAIERLEDIHQRLSSAIIEHYDALELINKYKEYSDTFFYLDPPYSHETRTSTRYNVDFSPEQQKKLVDVLLTTKSKVLLSGYANIEYERLEQAGWNRKEFKVATVDGAQNSKEKIECLWFNYHK